MNQEIVFAQTLEKVRRLAREQGNSIREEQVRESFAGLELGEAQMEMVFDYLRKHNVGIGEPGDQDAFMTEEERDYLQMYLDEIEGLPVCSDGQRTAYAMSVMAGDRAARQQLTESFLREVADIARLYAGQGVPPGGSDRGGERGPGGGRGAAGAGGRILFRKARPGPRHAGKAHHGCL